MRLCVRCQSVGRPLVDCTVCGFPKAPPGRDTPWGTRWCDWPCAGHDEPPHADALWPGERWCDVYPCLSARRCPYPEEASGGTVVEMDTCEKCGGPIGSTGTGRSVGGDPTVMSGECSDCGARYQRIAGEWSPEAVADTDD